MTTTTIYPPLSPAVEFGAHNPYQEMMSKIAEVYAESMRANAEQLWLSSARIVQEHAMRAFIEASQSCMEALAKNAAAVQQQSLARFSSANQKAVGIMGQAFSDAMGAGMRVTPPREMRAEWR